MSRLRRLDSESSLNYILPYYHYLKEWYCLLRRLNKRTNQIWETSKGYLINNLPKSVLRTSSLDMRIPVTTYLKFEKINLCSWRTPILNRTQHIENLTKILRDLDGYELIEPKKIVIDIELAFKEFPNTDIFTKEMSRMYNELIETIIDLGWRNKIQSYLSIEKLQTFRINYLKSVAINLSLLNDPKCFQNHLKNLQSQPNLVFKTIILKYDSPLTAPKSLSLLLPLLSTYPLTLFCPNTPICPIIPLLTDLCTLIPTAFSFLITTEPSTYLPSLLSTQSSPSHQPILLIPYTPILLDNGNEGISTRTILKGKILMPYRGKGDVPTGLFVRVAGEVKEKGVQERVRRESGGGGLGMGSRQWGSTGCIRLRFMWLERRI